MRRKAVFNNKPEIIGNETIQAICEDRVFHGQPKLLLSKRYNVTIKEIERILNENEDLVQKLKEERDNIYKYKFDNLVPKSYSAIKEILKTPHIEPILDSEGNQKYYIDAKGKKKPLLSINHQILKIKKEVAEMQLKQVGIVKEESKSFININNDNRSISTDTKELARKKEIDLLLEDCKVEEPTLIKCG